MCSLFEMENYQGDLTDIVRASGGGTYGCKTGGMPEDLLASDWQFPSEAAVNFSSSAMEEPREYSFGDPFCAAMRDPLLHELDMSGSSASTFFNGGTGGLEDNVSGGSCSFTASATVLSPTIGSHEDELKRPCNIFSRMLQISPARNKFPISPCDSPLLGNSPRALINTNSDLHHFVDNTGGVQISSPRNPAGIKRRKSQARKVVCVPAPVAASSRPNGEVIPSDLWAWRKYGQKPIKGSPYPRGYYRCSSSKGCSARKQVERSRTDPNMLVITYTSEHNHPWPTQRNALAGSSRSQQSKNNTANSKLSAGAQPQKPIPEGEKKEIGYEDNSVRGSAPSASTVKEELVEDMDKQFEADDGDFSEGFPYRLTMPSNNQSDDFFADLEELETDPLNLLFTQGAAAGGGGGDGAKGSKGLDVPFNLFDWAAENNANSTPFQEAGGKRGFY